MPDSDGEVATCDALTRLGLVTVRSPPLGVPGARDGSADTEAVVSDAVAALSIDSTATVASIGVKSRKKKKKKEHVGEADSSATAAPAPFTQSEELERVAHECDVALNEASESIKLTQHFGKVVEVCTAFLASYPPETAHVVQLRARVLLLLDCWCASRGNVERERLIQGLLDLLLSALDALLAATPACVLAAVVRAHVHLVLAKDSLVSADDVLESINAARSLRVSGDARLVLLVWDEVVLGMNAVKADLSAEELQSYIPGVLAAMAHSLRARGSLAELNRVLQSQGKDYLAYRASRQAADALLREEEEAAARAAAEEKKGRAKKDAAAAKKAAAKKKKEDEARAAERSATAAAAQAEAARTAERASAEALRAAEMERYVVQVRARVEADERERMRAAVELAEHAAAAAANEERRRKQVAAAEAAACPPHPPPPPPPDLLMPQRGAVSLLLPPATPDVFSFGPAPSRVAPRAYRPPPGPARGGKGAVPAWQPLGSALPSPAPPAAAVPGSWLPPPAPPPPSSSSLLPSPPAPPGPPPTPAPP